MSFLEIAAVLAALAAGAIVAWLIRAARARAELATAEARVAALEQASQRLIALEQNLAERERTIREQQARIAELETRLDAERRQAAEKLALLGEAQENLRDAFKALSADALKSNNQAFLQLAKETLEKFQEGARSDLEARQKAVDALVKPIQESLEKVDGKLGDLERARVSAYSALSEQLRSLVETQIPMLRSETQNLVKALRQPTVRGRWGEIQLKRVVEMAGMVERCDFDEQESVTTEDGRLRPDMIVHLPGDKCIVVDAKVPITAYLNAMEAADEATQHAYLAEHARQVRTHMSMLSRKAYWEQFDTTPEFVVLFLPGEPFFSAALQQDPDLIEFGVSERVILATPTTLIALLRAVAYGWRQEALAENAQHVAELGRTLYERIAKLAEHWGRVRDRLDKAVEAFNDSVGTLETRVLPAARKFQELKAAREDTPIEDIAPIERTARVLQAPELLPQKGNNGE